LTTCRWNYKMRLNLLLPYRKASIKDLPSGRPQTIQETINLPFLTQEWTENYLLNFPATQLFPLVESHQISAIQLLKLTNMSQTYVGTNRDQSLPSQRGWLSKENPRRNRTARQVVFSSLVLLNSRCRSQTDKSDTFNFWYSNTIY